MIINIVEKCNIPNSLILNRDQTPSKYVTVGGKIMAFKSSSRVGLVLGAVTSVPYHQRAVSLTLTVTLDGKLFPFYIIYSGKTKQTLFRVTFPKCFSTTFIETHYSYAEDLVKHLEEIILQ